MNTTRAIISLFIIVPMIVMMVLSLAMFFSEESKRESGRMWPLVVATVSLMIVVGVTMQTFGYNVKAQLISQDDRIAASRDEIVDAFINTYELQQPYINIVNSKLSSRVEYPVSVEKAKDLTVRTNYEIEKIISNLDKNKSELELAKELAKLIQDKTKLYDGDCVGSKAYTAYGALVNKEATCQGLHLAYKALLDRVGIEAHNVGGTLPSGEDHMRTKITIDSKDYYVDLAVNIALNSDVIFMNQEEDISPEYKLSRKGK